MSSVKVTLNLQGLNELMRGPEVSEYLQQCGETIAHRSGAGFEASTDSLRWIAATNVYPATKEAGLINYSSNVLEKMVTQLGFKRSKMGK